MNATLESPTVALSVLTMSADLFQKFLKHAAISHQRTLEHSRLIAIRTEPNGVHILSTDGDDTTRLRTDDYAGNFSGVFLVDDLEPLKKADKQRTISFGPGWVQYYTGGVSARITVSPRPPEDFNESAFATIVLKEVILWPDHLVAHLRTMANCQSADDDREPICGIRIEPGGVAVATSGRAMTVAENLGQELVEAATTFHWLPPNTLKGDWSVGVSFDYPPRHATPEEREKWVHKPTHIHWVQCWDGGVFTRVNKAKAQHFPDWRSCANAILEDTAKSPSTAVNLPLNMADILRRLPRPTGGTRAVKLSASGDAIQLSASTTSMEVGGTWAGTHAEWFIKFNPELILDALALGHGMADIKDDVSPAIFRSRTKQGEYSIIMPMRLNP
ncbi:MAG: hypothetical protein WCO60_20085 [Verrucomicrobiota bacterium]